MAIGWELGIESAFIIGATEQLILQDVCDGLLSSLDPSDQLHKIPIYAQEIRIIDDSDDVPSELEPTEIGSIALALSGRDAIRWLLTVEVTLSTGPDDPWRVDCQTLHLLGTRGRLSPAFETAVNWASMVRLIGFGLVDEEPGGFVARPQAMPLLREVGENSNAPMAVLVSALLDDDLRARLPDAGFPSTTAALTRQTKLVVHEIRNALIPVQEALRSVDRAAVSAGFEGSIEHYRRRIDSSVGRLLRFADELQDIASLTGESQDVFDPVSAIRDAIEAISAEFGESPDLSKPDTASPSVIGVRARFVLAVLNLFRNAYQAEPTEAASVSVNVVTLSSRVRITIDDNGPGVPQEHRERIFVDGYSMHPGGSGHGLALARATIEDEMGGTLVYEEGSTLGGARFIVTLPVHNGSAR